MTLATVICCTFAAVALISVLRNSESLQAAAVADSEPPTAPPAEQQTPELTLESADLDMFEEIPLESDPFAEVSDNEPAEVTFEHNHHRTTQVVSHSAPSEHLTPAEPSSESHSYAIPTERSLYVPVTVHPVTVNVDGTVFADEVSRLASSVDEMLEVQRTAIAQQAEARTNASQDHAVQEQLRERDRQLDQIDSSLRRLTESVETLRAESRRADAELTGKLHRDESASHLIREFRETLNEHRRLLERSAHQVAHTSRSQFDSAPPFQAQEVPLPERPVEPPGTPAAPQTVPHPSPVQVPVNESEPSQVEIIPPPATIHGAWSRQTVITDSCAEGDCQISSQSVDKEQAVATTEATTNETPNDATLLPPPIIIPAAASMETRPAVFEQTVNFAMPPTTDPLSHTTRSKTVTSKTVTHTTQQQTSAPEPAKQNHTQESQIKSGPRWMPKLIYGLNFQRPQDRKKKTHGHIKPGRTSKRTTRPSSTQPSTRPQRTTTQQTRHRQHTPVAATPRVPNPAGVTVPDTYVRRTPTRQQHRRHWPHTRSRTRQTAQSAATVAGNSVQALKQFGGTVKNRTADFLAKLRPNRHRQYQQQMQPHMHPQHRSMHASHQPPTSHRTGSAIRHVGHTQAAR